MNKFVKSGSKLLIVLVCFFVTSLFIDQANLLDVILGNNSNIDIEHPEEVDDLIIQTNPILNKVSYKKVVSSSKTDFNKTKNSQANAKKLIIDEDSPLTETSAGELSILNISFKNKDFINYSFVSANNTLYLLNRTLLI